MTRDEETGKKTHENPIVDLTNLAQAPIRIPNKFVGTNFLYRQCGCKLYLKNDTKRANQPPTYICTSYRMATERRSNLR